MVQAYVSTSLSLGDKPMATHFHQIQVDLRMMDADRVGIELLKEQKSEHLPSDMDGLQQSISKLQGMIDETLEYVEGVCDGKMKGNKEVGRYLMDTVSCHIHHLIAVFILSMWSSRSKQLLGNHQAGI